MATSVSSIRPFEPHTLGGQTRLLSHHLNGYFTLKILEAFCPLRPLSEEKIRQISVNHSFSALLEDCSGIKGYVGRNYLLPLLQKHLPSVIEENLLRGVGSISSDVPFPKAAIQEGIKKLIDHYADVEKAARFVAKQPILHDTVDRSIEDALGMEAEKAGRSEESLLLLSTQKLMREVVIKAAADKTPSILQTPVSLILRGVTWSMGLFFSPLLYAIKRSLPAPSKLSDEVVLKLSLPLKIAGCSFLKRLKETLEASWNNPTPRIHSLDRQLMKTLVEKQIAMLQIGSCTSQERLGKTFREGFVKDLSSTFQEKYLLDEVCDTIEEIVEASWKIASQNSFRQEQLTLLFKHLNQVFTAPEELAMEDSSIDLALDDCTLAILHHKIAPHLQSSGKLLDTHLSKFFDWDSRKELLSRVFQDYFGASIRDTVQDNVVSLALQAQKTGTERMVNFWKKPYNPRYGILHRQVLQPWVKA